MKIQYYKPYIGKDEIEAVSRVINSGWLTEGEEVRKFEKEFKKVEKCKYCLAVSSATMGIYLSFLAMNIINKVKKVAIPSYTFIGSLPFMAQFYLYDVNNNYMMQEPQVIDTDRIVNIPVHFGGQLFNLSNLDSSNLVIEDCAHRMPGFKYEHGNIWVYSFHANKNITTGDGGMICTNNKEYYDKLKSLYYLGIKRNKKRHNYDIVDIGVKANMTDLQAAIGRVQLKKRKVILQKRKSIAQKYINSFYGHDIEYMEDSNEHCWHIFTVRFKDIKTTNKVIKSLEWHNIGYSRHFKPLDRFSLFDGMELSTEKAWSLYKRTISLPIYPDLKNKEQDKIIRVILKSI